MARGTHQKREQAYPYNLVDERRKARNARNPEPGRLRGHRQLVFGHIVLVQRLDMAIRFSTENHLDFLVLFTGRRSHEADKPEHHRQEEVDGRGDAQRNVVSEFGNEHVACHQDADGRTETVREVEHRERDFGAALAHETCSDERERHAHSNRDWKRGTRSQHDFRHLGAGKPETRHPVAIEEETREQVVQRMVRHTAYADGKFHRRIPEQRTPHLLDHLARDKAADGKAAHVDAEREHLAIARMPEEEFEVAGPRAFVNEAGKPGEGEKEIDENVHTLIITKCKFAFDKKRNPPAP